MAGQDENEPLWHGSWAANEHAAAMLPIDLKAAGIAYRDDHGRVFDFHALRGQFATSLARAGFRFRVAQQLMRHSKVDLTMSVYTRPALVDLQAGLEALPPLPGSDPRTGTATLAATGTDDAEPRQLAALHSPNLRFGATAGVPSETTGIAEFRTGTES